MELIPFDVNSFLYAFICFAGTLTVGFLYVPVKAFEPTVLPDSVLVLIVILLSFLQLQNACLPILLTVPGLVILLRLTQFANAQ